MNGELAMPILVAVGERVSEAKNIQQIDGSLNYVLFAQHLHHP